MEAERTQEEILGDVVEMLVEVLGDDFLLEGDVDGNTSFSDDLAVESIEFVALADKLKQRYGDGVDFVAFIAEMEIDEIMALTVGELTAYIRRSLARSAIPASR